MAAYGLGRAPYPGVGGYSGECVLFVRLRGTRSLFTRLRLKMREEKRLAGGCSGGVWARSSLKEGGVPSTLASVTPSQPCRDAA